MPRGVRAAGNSRGPAFAFDAPPAAASPRFWETDECRAIVLEILALMHLPRIDKLLVRLPHDEVAAAARVLPARYAGGHVLRNIECRSQTLAVRVREVVVLALGQQPKGVNGARAA